MGSYRVTMKGQLLRRWPTGKEINLLSCTFSEGIEPRTFEVTAVLDAHDEAGANIVGREVCADAANLLEFCLDEKVTINQSEIHIKPEKSDFTRAMVDIELDLGLVADTPLTEEQMSTVRNVEALLDVNVEPETRVLLARVIHWQASGKRENQSEIDRFLKFWIALEVLVGGRGDKVKKKIMAPLSKLYPDIDFQKMTDVVGRLYHIRCDIVHFGLRHPQKFRIRIQQLENILKDLLRDRLCLEFKAFSKRFFK